MSVMRSERQKANLRRGGISPEAREKGWAARAANEAQDEAIEAMALESPMEAMEAMAAVALRDLSRALRRDARIGGEPSTAVTGRMREVRMLVESLNVYMSRRRSMDDQAAEFLGSLDQRMGALQEALSAEGPPIWDLAQPIFEPPVEEP
jgi:hypothetical protein